MASLVRAESHAGQFRDIGEAVMPVVDEATMAERLRRDGTRVVEHGGHHWAEARPGFYRPANPLARLPIDLATRPTLRSWGFQACLTDHDARHANAAFPVHLVSDLAEFDEGRLSSGRRYKLRRAHRQAQLVELTGPDLLREQGYEVVRSARERTGYGRTPTRDEYLASLDDFGDPARGIVLAGLIDGRLGGYVTGYAIDGTAFVGGVIISSEAMTTQIGTGLTYALIHAARRSDKVHELMHGLHAREDEGLCSYKEWMNLTVRRVPSVVRMMPGAGAFIRRRSPHVYYRLTGRG